MPYFKTIQVEDQPGNNGKGKFTEAMVEKAKKYLNTCVDVYDPDTKKIKVNLPSIGGLALHLGVNKNTLFEWDKKYSLFKEIMDGIRHAQEKALVNKGLSGEYNPTIAKLLLHSHGYKESSEVDHTTAGESMNNAEGHSNVKDILKNAESQLKKMKMES